MRGYLITLLLIAFLVGSLFRASEVTGMRIFNMFATFGIFLFGVVGSLALTRLQQRSGQRGVEEALKALEPDWVITDWSAAPGERPDYLLVGPAGLLAVCVEHSPGQARSARARRRLAGAADRARQCADWVRSELSGWREAADLPVFPLVLLSRMRAPDDQQEDGVPVLNPESLAGFVANLEPGPALSRPLRYRITRRLREGRLPETG
ncbi:hypothetical protein [Symbiobacterium thermophilum]|uniref:hypothetical protein n=1 Tax=Symbiobacterium thermophilum TaxID=2734 RepID=UPI0035C7640D